MNQPNGISRTFRDLSDKGVPDAESASLLAHSGRSYGSDWDDLLTARRILIVSEAGVGKTYECRACQQRLWGKGEPAFFLELATVADTDIVNMLSPEECARLDAWLRAQSETATFFLDSIDELKISQKSFEQALKSFGRKIAGHLNRARIVITTRPVPIDQQLIERHLPIPTASTAEVTAEGFAEIAMRRDRKDKKDEAPKLWREVGLMPLTREQIREFAVTQGVLDPDTLLADIERRHAEEYAQRPQDLIELCSDWKDHQRIRKHVEQVATNTAHKLKSRTDRPEKAALSDERAFEGASRLALAALLTRKLSIRYSVESDAIQSAGSALDAGKVLTNWPQLERDALLERALFGFANYGRVRFHHRSVIEYLAAKRLDALLQRGVPIKAVKRILFSKTAQGDDVVRPSLRAVAAWLSLSRNGIFGEVLRREPEALLTHGDPQSLTPVQRSQVLKTYVRRYGKGGWRGLKVPAVQVHRFASAELDSTVRQVWDDGIENFEVRELVLELIGSGKLAKCADIAHTALMDKKASQRERIHALHALIALEDLRLSKVSSSIETKPALWPALLARSATLRLFPTHLDVRQLCKILKRVQEPERVAGELSWRLPQLVDEGSLTPAALNDLRGGLTSLVLDGAEWRADKWPHTQTKRPDLITSLMTACNRQFREGVRTPELFRSSVLALRLAEDDSRDKSAKELQTNLANAPAADREQAFWADDAFLETLRSAKDAWQRVFLLGHHGGIHLDAEKDRAWVIRRLADKTKSVAEREMMLWAAMIQVSPSGDSHIKILEDLKPYVADAQALLTIIEERLKPSPDNEEARRLEEQSENYKRQRESQDAEAHASWVKFWKEIADNPDEVFEAARAENTAWNLWQAMERSGSDSRAAGWNRRFIEQQFGLDVADRLRVTLQRMWRKDNPTLRSERPAEGKSTFLVRWQLGLAAIYAEAEDPDWATKLTDEEARLASRFAPIELNGFPSWLDALVVVHPSAVDATLGNELSLSLRETGVDSDATICLQNVRHASPRVAALFVPRIKVWLDEVDGLHLNAKDPLVTRIRQAVDVLLQSEIPEIRKGLESFAAKRLHGRPQFVDAQLWLPVLIQLDPETGVAVLERALKSAPPGEPGLPVRWFATLFDRDLQGATIDLRRSEFSPKLLLLLVRLAYQHVRPADDVRHEDAYSPGERDHAERGRDAVLNALLATTGVEGWQAKLAMAADPLFSHLKDRVIAIARERAAEEVNGAALTEADVVALDAYGELPPTTRDAMFALMRDRLDDIDDLILQDVSPRELWAKITDERIMRRELARELHNKRNNMYTVDQESATADEKETDIRMRATRSDQQAVIELKIGEKRRTALELRTTIKDQLVRKYMAAEECRAGCLLITVGSDKTWTQPQKRQKLDFSGLIVYLNDEADRLSIKLGGTVRLMVKGLDLRPRLSTEKRAKATKESKSDNKALPQKAKRRSTDGRMATINASNRPEPKSRKVKARRREESARATRRQR
jgi:hypothetical protein